MSMTMKLILAVLALAPAGLAQYSDHPVRPLEYGGLQPIEGRHDIAATPDGGAYVCWDDNQPAPGGTSATLRLQRIDAGGRKLWPDGGVVVFEYDGALPFGGWHHDRLDVDAAGNAVVAAADPSLTGASPTPPEIRVFKVAPDGSTLWATAVTSDMTSDKLPRVAVTSDDQILVAWNRGVDIGVQRLDASGTPLWASPISWPAPLSHHALASLTPADQGSAVLVARGGLPPHPLTAQKVGPGGQPMWGAAGVSLWSGGLDSSNGSVEALDDGQGGLVATWGTGFSSPQVYVQHLLATGAAILPSDGLQVAGATHPFAYGPDVAYDASTGAIYLAFDAADYTLGTPAKPTRLELHRIDPTGARPWGPAGVLLSTTHAPKTGTKTRLEVRATGEVLAIHGYRDLHGSTVSPLGILQAGPTPISSVTEKDDLQTALSSLGHLHAAWDGAAGTLSMSAVDGGCYLPTGLVPGVATAADHLGAGTNPQALLAVTDPILGQTWHATVSSGPSPLPGASLLFVYGAPASGIQLPEGELLVDTTSPLVAVQLGDGGVPASSHALPIPPLIELAGISVTCQALRLDTSGHQLTNALTLTLGL